MLLLCGILAFLFSIQALVLETLLFILSPEALEVCQNVFLVPYFVLLLYSLLWYVPLALRLSIF